MCILIHTYVYFIVLSLSLCFPGPKHHTFKSFSCPSVSISCFISLYLSWGVSDLQILNVCNRCIKEFCVRTCLGKFLTKGNYHWMSIKRSVPSQTSLNSLFPLQSEPGDPPESSTALEHEGGNNHHITSQRLANLSPSPNWNPGEVRCQDCLVSVCSST